MVPDTVNGEDECGFMITTPCGVGLHLQRQPNKQRSVGRLHCITPFMRVLGRDTRLPVDQLQLA